jgi:hypothetical protein
MTGGDGGSLERLEPIADRVHVGNQSDGAGRHLALDDGHHAALPIDLRCAVAGDRQRHHGVLLHVLIRDLVVAKLGQESRALVGVGFEFALLQRVLDAFQRTGLRECRCGERDDAVRRTHQLRYVEVGNYVRCGLGRVRHTERGRKDCERDLI